MKMLLKGITEWQLELLKERKHFFTVHLRGGIGNQLFQYATLFGVAKEKNYEYGVPYNNKSLNEFSTFIYNAPLSGETYKKIFSSILVLRSLLTSELEDMNISYKNNNKTEDLTIHSYPDDFYDINFLISPNDVKDINYMPNYNIY